VDFWREAVEKEKKGGPISEPALLVCDAGAEAPAYR